jgi:hypothetical protein
MNRKKSRLLLALILVHKGNFMHKTKIREVFSVASRRRDPRCSKPTRGAHGVEGASRPGYAFKHGD